MPFEQFVQWQIAGDEFAPGNPLALAATAFLSLGVFPTQITINELERVRYEDMDDMLSTTGSAFLGLTIGCARCHDHKYDPIPTRDYYRMLSTFTGTVRSEIDLEMNSEETRRKHEQWRQGHEQLLADQRSIEETLIKEGRVGFESFLKGPIAEHPELEAWGLWKIREAKGSEGSRLVPLEDGSWQDERSLTDPNVPEKENFTFTGPVPYFAIRGLRIEALTDSRFPDPTVGRGENLSRTKRRGALRPRFRVKAREAGRLEEKKARGIKQRSVWLSRCRLSRAVRSRWCWSFKGRPSM